MATIAFKPIDGATPVAPAPIVPPDAEQINPNNLPAVIPAKGMTALGFYTGEEDSVPEVDISHLKLPRLNLVQGMSQQELKAFGLGEFVFKGAIKLPQPVRVVCCGFAAVKYIEDVKFGLQGRVAQSVQEVAAFGGTTEWRLSKKNEKTDSKLPWFQPYTNGLFLIEQPAGTDPDFFPYAAEGKTFALALYALKSTGFGAIYNGYQAEKLTGILRAGGYNARYGLLRSEKIDGYDGSFKPVLKWGESTSAEVRELARKAATGQ